MVRIITIAIFGLVVAAGPAVAQRVTVEEGFSFVPPTDWEVMPEDLIAHMRAFQDTAVESPNNEGYFAAGAAAPGETWFDFPYLLIRLDTVGPIHRDDLRRLIEGGAWEAPDEDLDRLKDVGLLQQMGDMNNRWDEELQAGTGFMEMTRADGVTVHAIQFTRPYRNGLISLWYYYDPDLTTSREAEQEARRVGTSIRMAPELAYDAAAARRATSRSGRAAMGLWERVIVGAIVGSILGGIGAVVGRARKKKGEPG